MAVHGIEDSPGPFRSPFPEGWLEWHMSSHSVKWKLFLGTEEEKGNTDILFSFPSGDADRLG